MNDRPSKKLILTMFAIQAVVGLSDGEPDKWPYAIIIGSIFAVYKIAQTFLDWKNNK